MSDIAGLLDALVLEELGGGRFRAPNVPGGSGVVFGGQLLAQSLVAGAAAHEGKEVKTLHTIFARGASPDLPLDVEVETIHAGRSFGSSTVTIRQGDRICTRSLALLSAREDDLIRHALPAPGVEAPPDGAGGHGLAGWHVAISGGVDINDPDATGPAELDVWTRFDVDDPDLITSQALLAYATDGFLIGTAMRPHPGVGQAQAHVTISTGVVSHTLTFHEPFRASEWLLLAHTSPYAGGGRTYGRADVYSHDGRLVASFVQDAMVRHIPEGKSPVGNEKAFL